MPHRNVYLVIRIDVLKLQHVPKLSQLEEKGEESSFSHFTVPFRRRVESRPEDTLDGRTGDADGVTDSKYNTRRRPTAEHYSLHGPRFLESLMQNCFTVERSLFYSCTNKDHYSSGACSSSGLKGDKYRHNSLEFPYYNDFAKRTLHI